MDTSALLLLVTLIVSVWGLIAAAVVWLALRSRAGTKPDQITALQAEMVALREQVGQNLGTVTRHVIPLSPNSFFAYLNVIVFGLRGLEIEENARELLGQLSQLDKDFGGCQASFDTLGKHIKHAHNRFNDLDVELGRFGDRLSSIAAGAALPAPDDQPALTG